MRQSNHDAIFLVGPCSCRHTQNRYFPLLKSHLKSLCYSKTKSLILSFYSEFFSSVCRGVLRTLVPLNMYPYFCVPLPAFFCELIRVQFEFIPQGPVPLRRAGE